MSDRPKRKERKEIEFEPDAWQRFERAVDIVAKSPPQPKKKKGPAKARPRGRKVAPKQGSSD